MAGAKSLSICHWAFVSAVVEGRTEEGEGDLPILLEGERACPPEDCGGAFGYMAALNGDLMWLDDDYDPYRFDPGKVKFSGRRRSRK